MASNLSSDFQEAVNYLTNSKSLPPVSSSVKLELYGLFKYITVSKEPTSSRPSIFDLTGRAKWDAWAAAGKKYKRARDAENRYLEIAKSMGWSKGVRATRKEPELEVNDERFWEDDNFEPSPNRKGENAGLGTSVSAMQLPSPVEDNSIHGLAVSNDVRGLKSLLRREPKTDLNEIDEYGYSALHLACDRGNAEFVQALLDNGADSTIKDSDGLTALELAKEAGHEHIQAILIDRSN